MTDETTDLIFEEPAARTRSSTGGAIRSWLDSLRQHPGQWSKFPTPWPKGNSGAGSAQANIKRGVAYGARPGEFEIVSRAGEGGTYLFARFIGGES